MLHAAFLIPAFPLLGFALLVAFGRRLGNPLAGWLATAFVAASFVVTAVVFAALFERAPAHRQVTEHLFPWFSVERLHVGVGLLLDPLSLTMAAFVTGVSALIHLYSVGYMRHDERFEQFFCYMNLFVLCMLMLVLSSNLLVTFFGWEGVGVCSYLLIAFWFERPSAASAGKKAMIYNRVGDAGFLLALFLIFERTGSLDYTVVFSRLSRLSSGDLVAVGLLLFLGAVGKSAQIPLFPWLADAMEGPTPVSALIHAATMVTAGVYLMCRINPVLHLAPDAAHVIAWLGAVTAFVAAMAATSQTDIKKVLAYSTVSQLGYMFLAAGSGAYVAAIFLMLTHAFYKALLFLGAGAVIHAMDEEQDLRLMGALGRLMPLTAVTFLVGWLAIAGVPPLSGFWSKGEVLLNAWAVSPALWAIGAVTAVLTAYYMGREYFLVFLGVRRWGREHGAALAQVQPHDPDWVMSAPIVVLAACSALAGFINLPFHPDFVLLERWLDPVVRRTLLVHHWSVPELWAFAVADGVLALAGVLLAAAAWRSASERPALEPRALYMAWFLDWALDRFIARPGTVLAEVASSVDRSVVDGAVNGLARLVRAGGQRLRRVQNGYVRSYALGLLGGVVVLVAYLLVRAGG
ncbi:MAG TPA: NADH-quinone oxidoreductase subunit L [Acidimicrobiales bacterium]|nr:NADH-quinone oxidoreductase subunit L [Acidimicrobiales bacterium]